MNCIDGWQNEHVSNGEVERTSARGSAEDGSLIVKGNIAGTVLFVATALFAAAVFTTPAQWVGASTAMGLFVIGVAAFLWGFWNAIQRSREEEVAVTQLFLLFGSSTPSSVRRTMLSLLAIQFFVALGTALWRIDGPDGTPGSSLAVGLLVPMFGLGMNGLWAAYHATFEPRSDVRADARTDARTERRTEPGMKPGAESGRPPMHDHAADSRQDVRTTSGPIDKNEEHG